MYLHEVPLGKTFMIHVKYNDKEYKVISIDLRMNLAILENINNFRDMQTATISNFLEIINTND